MRIFKLTKLVFATALIFSVTMSISSCNKEDDADKFIGDYTSTVEPFNLSITKIDAVNIQMEFYNNPSNKETIIASTDNENITINKQTFDFNENIQGSGSLQNKVLSLNLDKLDKDWNVISSFNVIYQKK